LEEEKTELEELLAEAESQQEAVNTAIEAKSQEIASYQAQIDAASGEQSTYEDQLDEQEKLLDQVEQQIAAAAAAKASSDDGDGGSSGFVWPCPSSHRITSSFGYRTAPIAGASTYHKGIDIGASSSAAIVASASGRVTTATYSSSAGNYVVISHGGGISTVYMHASALYVSEGDYVTQGQTIAAVGSTGYSTGPHLHFGVIVNGTYVDPTGYVN
ncbi:MAG: M23 family metallopeptidase, partial [Lachnospiraceae bacterium]|nr:M23 family metallopeptidase [Lachnospiraceae bacterium]